MPKLSLLQVVERADNFPYPPSLASSSNSISSSGSGHKRVVEPEHVIPFHLTFGDYLNNLPPIGLLRPEVVQVLLAESQDEAAVGADEISAARSPWQFYHSTSLMMDSTEEEDKASDTVDQGHSGTLELSPQCVFVSDWVLRGGSEILGKTMNEIAKRWRGEGKFDKPLGGEFAVHPRDAI